MNEKITVVYLDVKSRARAKALEIADDIEEYYRLIGCEYIDITRRSICKKTYCFIVDDLGLYDKNCIISAWDSTGAPVLVGNLIIAGNVDKYGNLTSLTKKDVDLIMRHELLVFRLEDDSYYAIEGVNGPNIHLATRKYKNEK